MHPEDTMTEKPKLRALPDPEPTQEEPATPKGHTVADLFAESVQLVEERANVKLTPEAAVSLYGITLNFHLAKVQMGLSQAHFQNEEA